MEDQPKLFTREELKSRCTRNDAVLIIHNEVYDVTSFLAEKISIESGQRKLSTKKGGNFKKSRAGNPGYTLLKRS
ncbi:hypothetical protein B5X24_HaOG201517 [Helicoverpa armigera]|nr:hypothetical protein B5X24_HaOG201517 [Helicoverpa armigera]